jgi:hypothetical protein
VGLQGEAELRGRLIAALGWMPPVLLRSICPFPAFVVEVRFLAGNSLPM